MEVRIGDKVRFLTETGGGKVVKIINNDTVMVYSDDYDFEIPTSVNDLVVIESDFNVKDDTLGVKLTNETEVPSKPIKSLSGKLYLAFLLKNKGKSGSDIDCYLINDTKDLSLYSFYKKDKNGYNGLGAGTCNGGESLFVESFSSSDLSSINSFLVHLIKYKSSGEPSLPLVFKMHINAVRFFKSSSYKNNDFFSEPAMICEVEDSEKIAYVINELTQTEKKEFIKQKECLIPREVLILKDKAKPIEVDLHINKLIDSVVGMSNGDILEYQLNKFHEVMEQYRLKKGQKVVFIHGIGNGTLKEKLLWDLKHKYKKNRFQDASFKEYGFGATMVSM